MEKLIEKVFIHNWQQKLVALLMALLMWFFLSYSIIETKIIPSVPIRVVNIPSEYTILGLMPNGILNKRITLTLNGTKDVVERLEPGDLELVIDASIIDHSDWVLRINKKNLVSLDPSIDLSQHITNIYHSEYVIKLRRMVTEAIPVTILPPKGEAPPGYEFLAVFPQQLEQTYSAAAEEIQRIKTHGLELQFDLSRITKADLDHLAASTHAADKDEIAFYIPNNWKKIMIPCLTNSLEELNDPNSDELQIDFLKKQVFPIKNEVPLRIFYPLNTIRTINPETYPIALNDQIKLKKGITVFTPQLYVHDVTQDFLNTIRDNLEIVVTAAISKEKEPLHWNVEIINSHDVEERYVETLFKLHPKIKDAGPQAIRQREGIYRKRFREYMQKLSLNSAPEQPLVIDAFMDKDKITIKSPAS